MYTQEQIEKDRKHYLEEMKKNANDLLKKTVGTELCWEVSAAYDLDDWEKNIIEVCRTEEEAIAMIKGMKEEGIELFYRPVVIDDDSGELVTFQNLHYYQVNSYFVKSLDVYM